MWTESKYFSFYVKILPKMSSFAIPIYRKVLRRTNSWHRADESQTHSKGWCDQQLQENQDLQDVHVDQELQGKNSSESELCTCVKHSSDEASDDVYVP